MSKKKAIQYYPDDFPNINFEVKFRKPRSPRTRILSCSDKDKWFVDVIEIKTRTREVVDNEGWITMKDIQQWIDWYKRLGWEVEK